MAETTKTQDEMSGAYEPGKIEQKWYQFWLEKDYFKPVIDKSKKPFVIIMPPPNVTGELHLGHALTATLEDIMTRWHRMLGDPTLWLPGVDHASIAAQVVVERLLAKEGTDRHALGREKFLERMWQWMEKYRHIITEQHKRLGVSCDWSREAFTMDAGPSRAVRTTFLRLYEKGLIYRGERIINWCPRCCTALSDLEVEHQDVTGHLWYVRYRLADGSGYITVATTRPETILGDTAVAVNPEDERFKGMVGKKAILPVLKREIPIIADAAIDIAFGTGAVKITPAHDPVDFDVAGRHKLSLINILNDDATMNQNAGPYAGMDRFKCREAIVADMGKEGLLVKIEPYSHAVAHCERCHTLVEPIASLQWFVKIEPLAKPAIDAVVDGRIKIVPEHFAKVYLNWMENIHDWCISRQLWWGHRIPVWYCRNCGEVIVAIEEPKSCLKCGSADIEQDPDTLDTWFSSGLWPHATLGWPDDTEDLRYFYPTSVMETAYDIIFFWVARMIMLGIENMGEVPFHTVYFHGLIRDENGVKMSKTLGNAVDPIETMEKYGTDALRFAVITGTSAGNDSKMSLTKLEAGRNFANKLWNATRFVLKSVGSDWKGRDIEWDLLHTEDRWILSRLNRIVAGVNKSLAAFQFAEAQAQIYDFLWNEFCDWYIELAKIRLRAPGQALTPLTVLVYVLETGLRLLHPYMPFLTEELWQSLKRRLSSDWPAGDSMTGDSIMVAPYPFADEKAIDPEAERVMDSLIEIIRAIRNARAEHNVESGRWIEAQIYAGKLTGAITPYSPAIETLARARPVTIRETRAVSGSSENSLVLVLKETEVVIPVASMVDLAAEKARLEKEIEQAQAEVTRLETRLKDEGFLAKAPPAVVEKERQKCYALNDKLGRLKQQMLKY
ncbi:MAG TPA: valine--tRNA ligase [Dehalococcoidales bacterium]|nr:valine--tRNA ligase [Dehalococcoidales bacterium]